MHLFGQSYTQMSIFLTPRHISTNLMVISYVTKGQIPFIDILAAGKIRAKCVALVNRLRI